MLPRIEYDREADAAYVYFADQPYAYGEDLDDARRIDFAADGSVIGVELLWAGDGVDLAGLPRADELADLLGGVGIRVLAR